MELPEVEDMFIFPPAGDDSISIGAAILAYLKIQKKRKGSTYIEPLKDLYLGEDITEKIEDFIANLDTSDYRIQKPENINEVAAYLLASNKIVARFAGRMEYGPRALGNRSILANPSDLLNVHRLNSAIKCRDFWMPFAGTILDKYEDKYIINPKKIRAPYMILSFDTVPENRKEIIAAIHQSDFTIRPQILDYETNPDYYEIIDKFAQLTGIGAVLNTSLNLHGHPIVNLPEEAFHLLQNSALEYMILGPYMLSKVTADDPLEVMEKYKSGKIAYSSDIK